MYSDNINIDLSAILDFIKCRNKNTQVCIKKISLEDCFPWYYDEETGTIHNKDRSFFEIAGITQVLQGKEKSQPIIIQNEIGYLGMLCCRTSKGLEFLVQAKIEPGNINAIQLSPTIQATKSNFTQKHGGKHPEYLEFFLNADSSNILVDQIQSEQSSRFLKKRNRNIIVLLERKCDVKILQTHMWVSLSEIKALMRYNNLVNMDTRTVLSCIPYSFYDWLCSNELDDALAKSIKKKPEHKDLKRIYHDLNNYKMFAEIGLKQEKLFALKCWRMQNNEFVYNAQYPFKVVFCDISIEGREVKQWRQPLFEANGKAIFGLLCKTENAVKKFLVKITPEIGCFDYAELGPSLQLEAFSDKTEDTVTKFFFDRLSSGKGVVLDVMLSEEGGRFYHEENRNVIIEIEQEDLSENYDGYYWCDYATLNYLSQINNCLNIQLRNLLSLLRVC